MSIRKIAELADVSITTVSRVINDHPYVSDAKRQRVLDAMEKINYVPNRHAINLSNGHSETIGLLVPYSRNSCYEQLIEGALEEASIKGKQVMILPTYFDENKEKDYYTFLRDKTLDGMIITSRTQDSQFLNDLQKYGPIVTTELTSQKSVPSVYPDRQKIYQDVFDFFSSTYPDLPLYLTTQRSPKTSKSSFLKQEFMIAHYPHQDKEKFLIPNITNFQDGLKVGEALFKKVKTPFCIYANGDDIAAGIIKVAKHNQKVLHRDFFILGENNLAYSDLLNFNTVDFHLKTVAKQAVNLLLSEEQGQTSIRGNLIFRQKN